MFICSPEDARGTKVMFVTGTVRSLAAMCVMSLMVLGGFLVATASPSSNGREATAGWNPKDTDWAQFRHDAARGGSTPANATMRLAYFKWAARTGSNVYSSPAVASLRPSMNITEVVVGSYDGRLYCVNGMNGLIRWRYQSSASIQSSPAMGDLNGDGRPEVVFGGLDSRIYALNGINGTLLWRYTARNGFRGSPAIADLDGDGMNEVVIGGTDGIVYAITGSGTRLWGFQTPLPSGTSGILASPAVGDINGDGLPEVVMPAGNGAVYALAGADGKELWNFSTGVNRSLDSTPAIADLDGDGDIDIAVAGGRGGPDTNFYCINGKDGKEVWRSLLGTMVGTSSPAVGDGDADGDNEIYFGTDSSTIMCLDGVNGTVEWSRQFTSAVYSSPALADIDGDGRLELVVGGMDRVVRALNAEDGMPAWAYPCPSGVYSSPAVADLDNDGKAEVTFGCTDGRLYAIDYNF